MDIVQFHVRIDSAGEGTFLYSAVSSPWDCYTSRPGRTVHSNTNLLSLGCIQSLLHEDYSFTYLLLSIAGYSFIQLSELRQCGVNEIAKASKWQQEESMESDVLTTTPPPPIW